jgi:hypothetical protein
MLEFALHFFCVFFGRIELHELIGVYPMQKSQTHILLWSLVYFDVTSNGDLLRDIFRQGCSW